MEKTDKGIYIGKLKVRVKELEEKEIKRIQQIKMLESKLKYWKDKAQLGAK